MEIGSKDLLTLIESGKPPVILDVRSSLEFAGGRVPGAIHLPFWSALLRPVPANPDALVVVYCGQGPRAEMAATALRARGFRNLRLLSGHMSGWRRAGLPVEM